MFLKESIKKIYKINTDYSQLEQAINQAELINFENSELDSAYKYFYLMEIGIHK